MVLVFARDRGCQRVGLPCESQKHGLCFGGQSLNGSVYIPPVRPVQKQSAKKKYDHLYLPPFNLYCQNVRPYLLARGIDKEIIDLFIDRRLLAEDCKTGAALFFGRDEAGQIMQCSLRATDGTPRKKDLAGSNRKYAFGLFSEGRTTVRVFEAAIDLMSYLTLQKRCGQDYLNTNAISLSGVFLPNEENLAESKIPESLTHYLKQDPTEKILLHLDSDDAGRRFAAAMCAVLEKEYDISYHPPPAGKDFNEYLQLHMKCKKERENEAREH